MRSRRDIEEQTALAPWRAVYDVLPLGDEFEDALERMRQQDVLRDAGPDDPTFRQSRGSSSRAGA